ncbi:AHH domain-containing protein [Vibrio alginolyticus]|uniref:AHH domain-containing protein n=1 Tax=Vibrio alginolyticus TaxID=663 RepID=UPI0040686DE1
MTSPNRSPVMALPKRPSNPTPLELAIYNFEKLALAYNKNLNSKNKQSTERLKRDWEHLQRERLRISIQAELQKELEHYREQSRNTDPEILAEQPHHPTRTLARNLTAIAEPKPSPDHDPHHIVMGKGRWRAYDMMKTRLALHAVGIGINDPTNGVWLPRRKSDKGHWATPKAPAHKDIHRFNYETWIVTAIGTHIQDAHTIKNKLRHVKVSIKNGTHPPQILKSKDPSWNGA